MCIEETFCVHTGDLLCAHKRSPVCAGDIPCVHSRELLSAHKRCPQGSKDAPKTANDAQKASRGSQRQPKGNLRSPKDTEGEARMAYESNATNRQRRTIWSLKIVLAEIWERGDTETNTERRARPSRARHEREFMHDVLYVYYALCSEAMAPGKCSCKPVFSRGRELCVHRRDFLCAQKK